MTVPMLQVAMDYITLPPALAMAVKVAPEVDIIEIGTPLCKAVGLDGIRAMRELVGPDKLILADFKSPDVGGLEAKMAFDAGADMMTVIGGAALATVESGARGGQGGQEGNAHGADRRARHPRPRQGMAADRRRAHGLPPRLGRADLRPPVGRGRPDRRSASSSTWASRSPSPAASTRTCSRSSSRSMSRS